MAKFVGVTLIDSWQTVWINPEHIVSIYGPNNPYGRTDEEMRTKITTVTGDAYLTGMLATDFLLYLERVTANG